MNPNFIPLDAVSTRRFDLDAIQIATPCRADWDAMSGDDQVRHCQSCAKNVYNLSALTRAEATRLIEQKEGHLCVQLHRRRDGTLITADCPVGISSFKKGGRTVKAVFAAAMAAVLSVFGVTAARASDPRSSPMPTRTLGTPLVPHASSVRGKVAPMKNAPMLMGEAVMPEPKMGKPVLGQPKTPVRTVTMGRIIMPKTKKLKSSKNHAKHTSPSAANGATGAARHQRHRR